MDPEGMAPLAAGLVEAHPAIKVADAERCV
jgi:hypothetical protein